jgi:hypothetical protein
MTARAQQPQISRRRFPTLLLLPPGPEMRPLTPASAPPPAGEDELDQRLAGVLAVAGVVDRVCGRSGSGGTLPDLPEPQAFQLCAQPGDLRRRMLGGVRADTNP